MRLQLIIAGILFLGKVTYAQTDTTRNMVKKVLSKNEVDFLFSYYHQDGNNSAVTGGAGTEKLSDFASTIVLKLASKPTREFIAEHNTSYYSSASSDNINPTTVSSASSTNMVHKISLTKVYKDSTLHRSVGVKIGGTHQNNFGGFSIGGLYAVQSLNRNRELKLQASFTFDKWALYYHISKLYPVELKGKGDLVDTDKRYSYNFSVAIKQVLTPRVQIQLASELIYQTGLLSTPFHRVYFVEQTDPKLEHLPAHRLRLPFTFRTNYYAFDRLIVRSYYRYYMDDFGLQSHTINVELPYKITNFFSVYPFVNYHTQNAIRYFQTYKKHHLIERYYTSDFDLSSLWSIESGAGIYYSPVNPIYKFCRRADSQFVLKTWELRYGYYWRSTNLHAGIITTHLGFAF